MGRPTIVPRKEGLRRMTTFKIIACSTIRDEVEALRGDIPVEYLEGFLHDTPDVLRDTINERIAATPGDCTILLAYGRCSNGTAGLVAGRSSARSPGLRRLHRPAARLAPRIHAGVRRTPRHLLLHARLDRGARRPVPRVPQDDPSHGRREVAMVAHMILEAYTRVAVIDTGTYDLEKARSTSTWWPTSTACPSRGSSGLCACSTSSSTARTTRSSSSIEPGRGA